MVDEEELRTDTFSNARGWTAVRVTHTPSGTVAERIRSASLKSAVEAQRECISEIKERLADGFEPAPEPGGDDRPARVKAVTRAEFDALAARVDDLERQIGER